MSTPFRWPEDCRCAVSLTYDDALPIHYEYVAPRLEAHKLRGTFYLKIAADPMQNPAPWRELSAHGHELGNHTLFHPCRRDSSKIHPWLENAFDLRDYTPLRLRLELRVANAFLHLLDGKNERTFANTCFDMFIGRRWNKKLISDLIRNDFVAARGARTDQPAVVSSSLDLMNVGSFLADGRRFKELRDQICIAKDQGAWLIYTIHGIGPATHSTFVEAEIHEQLLSWLAGQPLIWVRPFIEVANWVGEWQQRQ
jgi:peptidoglycan/xylan/chitin deacetylase (PgdA/CDA1 family)